MAGDSYRRVICLTGPRGRRERHQDTGDDRDGCKKYLHKSSFLRADIREIISKEALSSRKKFHQRVLLIKEATRGKTGYLEHSKPSRGGRR